MPLARPPWREVAFLVAALATMLGWVGLTTASKVYPLLLVAVLAVLVQVLLRRGAHRTLDRASDSEFLAECGVERHCHEDAIWLRGAIARAFGLAQDRVGARSSLCEFMKLTGWFGSDLLALSEVQRAFQELSGQETEVKPETVIGDLVRLLPARRL